MSATSRGVGEGSYFTANVDVWYCRFYSSWAGTKLAQVIMISMIGLETFARMCGIHLKVELREPIEGFTANGYLHAHVDGQCHWNTHNSFVKVLAGLRLCKGEGKDYTKNASIST